MDGAQHAERLLTSPLKLPRPQPAKAVTPPTDADVTARQPNHAYAGSTILGTVIENATPFPARFVRGRGLST